MTTRLSRTLGLLEEGLAAGLHVGYQLYVELGGRCVADEAGGEARPGLPMRSDTIMLWLSSGKPVTAVAIARQAERNALDLHRPVADYLPAFAAGGKAAITPFHLLTHTSGFRAADTGWPDASWEDIIERICRTRLEPRWVVGEKAGYHPGTSWFILAELVRRSDGRNHNGLWCCQLGQHLEQLAVLAGRDMVQHGVAAVEQDRYAASLDVRDKTLVLLAIQGQIRVPGQRGYGDDGLV